MARRREKKIVWVPHKRKKFTKAQREFVFKRDSFMCQLCGKDLSNLPQERRLDHKVPLSQFGSNDLNKNIWLLCSVCDTQKKSSVLHSVVEDRINELKRIVHP